MTATPYALSPMAAIACISGMTNYQGARLCTFQIKIVRTKLGTYQKSKHRRTLLSLHATNQWPVIIPSLAPPILMDKRVSVGPDHG